MFCVFFEPLRDFSKISRSPSSGTVPLLPLQYLFSYSINNSLSGSLLHFCALSFKTPPL